MEVAVEREREQVRERDAAWWPLAWALFVYADRKPDVVPPVRWIGEQIDIVENQDRIGKGEPR